MMPTSASPWTIRISPTRCSVLGPWAIHPSQVPTGRAAPPSLTGSTTARDTVNLCLVSGFRAPRFPDDGVLFLYLVFDLVGWRGLGGGKCYLVDRLGMIAEVRYWWRRTRRRNGVEWGEMEEGGG